MAEIANFPNRKKTKGFLSSMTSAAAAPHADEAPETTAPESARTEEPPRQAKSEPSNNKSATHNTTVNLTQKQRAWLRWREVVTKQSMGDLIREAIEARMKRTPMPPEVAAIFGASPSE